MAKVMLFFQKCAIFLFFAIFFTAFNELHAQKTEVSGTVLDEVTKEPVVGANVFLVNEKTGAVTDADGKFTVYPTSFPASISVGYVSYKTLQLELYEYTEPLIVYLTEDLLFLSEIVVIGYGTQKRKELTGAIQTIPAKTLSQIASSFDQSLGGSVAGLNVTQSSGQPGATTTVRIRGGNSITGGNEPLYVNQVRRRAFRHFPLAQPSADDVPPGLSYEEFQDVLRNERNTILNNANLKTFY